MLALSQLPPEAVPRFFAEADKIAAISPPAVLQPDELARVTEPMKQLLNRLITGHAFWMSQLEGASTDPQRGAASLRNMFLDYTSVSAGEIRMLAQKYLKEGGGWRLAVPARGRRRPELQKPGVAPAGTFNSRLPRRGGFTVAYCVPSAVWARALLT